jgi:hypothetical protein
VTDLLLPAGSRLLHIGPHKTGTTALQGAFVLAREELKGHGVLYPGRGRQHSLAARAATGRPGPRGDRSARDLDWTRLVAEVAAAGDQRVVISSESFAMADDDTARSVVSQLGGDRIHVLVTLRPLVKLLPSSWQQYVREGLPVSYGRWLDGMLRTEPYDRPTPSFWHRNRHQVLVERWAQVAGPENLTVIVVDAANRDMLTDTVGEMLGLPPGVLKPEPGRANRSLTYGEIELVRQLNREFRDREWSDENFRYYIRQGMIAHLQRTREPGQDEVQIPTPRWAQQRAGEIGAEAAAAIATLGVRVVGDLSLLAEGAVDPDGPESIPPAPDLPLDVASEAVIGILQRCVSEPEPEAGAPEPQGARPVGDIATRELAGLVARRVGNSVRRQLRGPARAPSARRTDDAADQG